jgi:hypothetical protein
MATYQAQKKPGVGRNLSPSTGIPRKVPVDCAEIRQGFMTREVLSGPSLDEHLKVCRHCAELCNDSGALGRRLASVGSQAPGSTSLQLTATESLIERERGLRAFLRSRSTRVRWLLSLSLPALLLARELLGKRVPWRQLRQLSASRMIAGLLLLGLFGLVAHSALRPLPIQRRAARLRSALAVVAWCLPCVLWFAPEAQASADEFSGAFAWRSLTCFAYGSVFAAPACALLWAMDRGVRVPYRVWALAAASVALLANLILMLHCPITGRAHLVAGHFSIGLAWFAAVSSAEWCMRRAE